MASRHTRECHHQNDYNDKQCHQPDDDAKHLERYGRHFCCENPVYIFDGRIEDETLVTVDDDGILSLILAPGTLLHISNELLGDAWLLVILDMSEVVGLQDSLLFRMVI